MAAEVDAATLEAAAMADEMADEEAASSGKRQRGAGGKAVEVPDFEPITAKEAAGKTEFRRIQVPQHRYSPLRKDWMSLYTPIVEHLKLDVRMNPRNRCVEIKTSAHTQDIDHLQKAADFVRAYTLGFSAQDAVALLRVEDLFVDSFMARAAPWHKFCPPADGFGLPSPRGAQPGEPRPAGLEAVMHCDPFGPQVTDVKMLKGDHLSRAIGRVAGKDGEGARQESAAGAAARSHCLLPTLDHAPRSGKQADNQIHILGSFSHIKAARDACCNLILGSPPSKVATSLRAVSSRMGQRI